MMLSTIYCGTRLACRPTVLTAILLITAQLGHCENLKSLGGVSYRGFSQPWESIDVAVAQPGRVDEVSVREGQSVKRGELLAKLDNEVLLASLKVAEQRASAGGERESARARLNHAARRRDDIEALLNESHASQTELDQAELAVREAEAALLTTQEKRDIAQADVGRIEAEIALREVRSPVDGIVIELKRHRGEYAGASDPVVARVAVLQTLRLRINVPTNVALQLTREAELTIEFPEIKTNVAGTVDFISPITDSQSGTVRVDIRLENKSKRLRSGLLGVWRCPSEEHSDRFNLTAGKTSASQQQFEANRE